MQGSLPGKVKSISVSEVKRCKSSFWKGCNLVPKPVITLAFIVSLPTCENIIAHFSRVIVGQSFKYIIYFSDITGLQSFYIY